MNGEGVVPRTPPHDVPAPAVPRPRSAALTRLARRVAEDPAAGAEFWAGLAETPLVEPIPGAEGDRAVSFLWRDGDSADVLVNVNKVTDGIAQSRMERLAGTDVWFATFRLPARWRGSYGFVPLGEGEYEALAGTERRELFRALRGRAAADPRNPRREVTHTGGTMSVAELDQAPPQPWLRPAPAGRRGRTERREGPGGRTVWVHTPAGEPEPGGRPLVVLLDGEVWHASGHAVATVDTLAAEGRIRAPHLVMLDAGGPARRIVDLAIDGDTARYLVEELLPWARERMAVSADPRDVVVAGQSLGGLTALKAALDHPAHIGAALSQSASLWQHDMLARASGASSDTTRVFLEVGTREHVLLGPHRTLRDRLAEQGVLAGYAEYEGGHDLACWRGGMGDGLCALLPARPVSGQPRKPLD